MYPAAFDYLRPSSVEEVIQILADNPEAKIIAGGHSLLPAMKLRLAAPGALVDLAGVSGLTGIAVNGGAEIGPMTTYDDAMGNAALAENFAALHQAVSAVGDVQVRNRGTIGGSAAHADPAADVTAALVAHNAEFVAQGPNGQRSVAADDFFIDLFTTALEPDEVLVNINLPAPEANSSSAYAKFVHPASGYPVCGVAAVVTRDGSGNVGSARVVATGSTLRPTRLSGVEEALTGTSGDGDAVAAAAEHANDGVSEWAGDHYASSEYRAHLTKVFAKRALNAALGNG